jgi:hypothetical protein
MDISKIITDYINSPSAEGAIMINGDWGVGKSFYWRNTLIPKIEKIENKSTNKHYKCLYVSLNGMKNPEDIFNQLVISKLPWTKSKAAKIAYSVGGLMFNVASKVPFLNHKTGEQSTDTFKNFKLEDFLDFRNNVICFDDLERISSKNTSQFLGFISTNFIETNRIKVIILSNEKEIWDKEDYIRIKEKTITRTLNFDKSIVNLSDIFRRYDKEYNCFFQDHIQFIQAIIETYRESNLRTIIFALDILNRLYHFINTRGEELEHSVILFTFLISIEFKKGRLVSSDYHHTKNLENLSNKDYKNILFSRAIAKQVFQSSKKDDSETQEVTYEYVFYERYNLAKRSDFFFFETIYKYILSGYLNEEKLKLEFLQYQPSSTVEENTSPQQFVYNNLLRVYWLNDDLQLTTSIADLKQYMANGDYMFYEYGSIYSIFKQLDEQKLLDEDIQRIKELAISGLQNSLIRNLDPEAIDFIRHNVQKSGDSEMDHIIEEAFQKIEKNKNEAYVDGFFIQLQNEDDQINSKYQQFNVFQYLTANEIYNRIKSFDLNAFRNFITIITGILQISNISEYYSTNKEEIPKLKEKLTQLASSENSKLRKYIIGVLIKQLEKFIERLD